MTIVIGPGVTFQGGAAIVGGILPGQQEFVTPGTYTFVVPQGVTVVNAVLIGGGGGADNSLTSSGFRSGGGGGLRWINRLPVTPGETLEVVVGAGGTVGTGIGSGTAGGDSILRRASDQTVLVQANGGRIGSLGGGRGTEFGFGPYGGVVGGGHGGNSDATSPTGGGGAGGYTGNGGNGQRLGAGFVPPTAGSGGGGGGGCEYGGAGGGVGIYGQGANGAEATVGNASGQGGSGGTPVTPNTVNPNGGLYGGGAGAFRLGEAPAEPYTGGHGAVRIIWGDPRAFPSTNTGDL